MYAANFEQVGVNIKKYMEKNGFSQQKLANILGVSKQVMNKIVRGSKAINVAELAQIATAIGVTVEELLTVDNVETSIDDMSFMGDVTDQETLEKINIIRSAIDEIHMLEDMRNG